MRRTLLPFVVALCVACDATSPADEPLRITAQEIDSARAVVMPEFDDAALAALWLGSSASPALTVPRANLGTEAASTDPVLVPDAIRGRRFSVVPPGVWVGVPDPSVPANGVVMTLYQAFPFAFGDNRPAVGTLTIVDSSAFPTAIAVVTARNLSGRVVLRARIREPLPGGEYFATASFGGATADAATLTDSVDVVRNLWRSRFVLAGRDLAWQREVRPEFDERALVTRGQTVTARRFARGFEIDSTGVSVNGRFVGAVITGRGVVGNANPADAALVAAATRFFDSVPSVNLVWVLTLALQWAASVI